MGSAYGYQLEPELEAVLRGPVPAEALRWVEEVAGARVVDQQALPGGTSSAVHRLRTDAAAPRDQLVLRRYVLDWVRDEPEIPPNEAATLRLLAAHPTVPAPQLVASDPDGSRVGVPATVMTGLAGQVDWRPVDRTAWLRSLAEVAIAIHRLPVTDAQLSWAPYPPDSRVPPGWSRHPEAWLTAYAQWDGPTPPSERVFLHRDFHPGNVLWTGEEITGVVDWTSSCAGPAEEDIGHCRANLAIARGQDWAEEFLAIWMDLTGTRHYDPYWDLTNVVSFDHRQVEPGLDEFVAAAAARL